AVQDLERVRAALGVGRIDLYGTSYGTRVAQHYLRRFPQRVRALILDGVVPAPVVLGPATASDAERVLLDILARCAGEPACRACPGRAVRPRGARGGRAPRSGEAQRRGGRGGVALLCPGASRPRAPRRPLPRRAAAGRARARGPPGAGRTAGEGHSAEPGRGG